MHYIHRPLRDSADPEESSRNMSPSAFYLSTYTSCSNRAHNVAVTRLVFCLERIVATPTGVECGYPPTRSCHDVHVPSLSSPREGS